MREPRVKGRDWSLRSLACTTLKIWPCTVARASWRIRIKIYYDGQRSAVLRFVLWLCRAVMRGSLHKSDARAFRIAAACEQIWPFEKTSKKATQISFEFAIVFQIAHQGSEPPAIQKQMIQQWILYPSPLAIHGALSFQHPYVCTSTSKKKLDPPSLSDVYR